NTAALKFQAGDLDALDNVKAEDYHTFEEEQERGRYTLYDLGPALNTNFFWFNLNVVRDPGPGERAGDPHVGRTKYGWFSRREFRQAVSMAIDRDAMIRGPFYGEAVLNWSQMTPGNKVWGSNPDLDPWDYDPEAAKAKLDARGYVDRDGDGVRENAEGLPLGIELKYNTGNQQRQDIAEIMQAQLAEVGVAVRATVVEPSALQAQVFGPERREFDGLVFGFVSDFRVDDRDLFHSDRIEQPFALTGTRNPELDRLMDTLAVIVDAKAAKPLWDEYQRLLDREHPNTFLYFPDKIDAFGARMRGVSMDVRGEWAAVREWWIEPSLR
ncbi:MAG TPA: ABC transporter substrate-binding protein, partial [Longimicrobiales bacterium]|nr:ABC transporter substrate-binding protein [Longimicrobiales bacterium]